MLGAKLEVIAIFWKPIGLPCSVQINSKYHATKWCKICRGIGSTDSDLLLLGMDEGRGTECLYVCKDVEDLSAVSAFLSSSWGMTLITSWSLNSINWDQCYRTVSRSLILCLKTKTCHLAILSLTSNGGRKNHASPLKSSRNWRWDLIVSMKKRS